MGSIFNRHYINRALLSTVLSSFTLTYSLPLPANQFEFNIGFNEVAFMIRLEKVVEKLVKSESKGIDKIIECFVDVKEEIESSYGVRLNIDDYFHDVSKELNRKGVKTPKKEFDVIKKKIKAREKKKKSHWNMMANVMYQDDYQFTELDDHFCLKAKHSHDKDDKKDDDKEIVVPALLVYGVTLSLCGMFLMIIPIPA